MHFKTISFLNTQKGNDSGILQSLLHSSRLSPKCLLSSSILAFCLIVIQCLTIELTGKNRFRTRRLSTPLHRAMTFMLGEYYTVLLIVLWRGRTLHRRDMASAETSFYATKSRAFLHFPQIALVLLIT